jgi:hypothetical protein
MDENERTDVFVCMKRMPQLLVLLLVLVSCGGRSPTDPSGGSRATLSGRVTDPYGHIWGGVSIGVVRPNGGVVASGLTGDNGRYSIGGLTPGPYRVWLQLGRTGPGYFAADVDLREGRNTLDIVSR